MHKRILITIILGAILVLGFYIITNRITKYTGFSISNDENDFEICLKEQDITLYVNTNNLANSLREIQINNLDNLKIKNCLSDKSFCEEKGVNSFPTWIINNNKIDRDISFIELEEVSGCSLIIK